MAIWKELIAPAVGITAAIATGGIVDPVAGAALASGLLAGKIAKDRGKEIEHRTGRPVHKATAPAAAIAAPTAFMLLAQQLGVDITNACEASRALVDVLCGNAAVATGALAGVGAILTHVAASATRAATTQR